MTSFGGTVSVCFNSKELSDPIQALYIIHLIIQAKDFSKCPLYDYLWRWKAPLRLRVPRKLISNGGIPPSSIIQSVR